MPAEATRAKLLAATADVLRTRGMTGTTIREIAKAAGVAEGALYRHFPDKVELIKAVMLDQWPSLGVAIVRLLDRVGTGDPQANLTELVIDAVDGYRELVPFVATLTADPAVLEAVRAEFRARDMGPVRAHDGVVRYLAAEVDAGRLTLAAEPFTISAALLGACHEYAFIQLLHAAVPFGDVREFAAKLVQFLLS